MGFFNTLRHVLGGDEDGVPAGGVVLEGGGLTDEAGADAGPAVPPVPAGAYDRGQWLKSLKRVLDELPASRAAWDDLMTSARALELEPEWVADRQREEFLLLVRRAVSDRVVTESEHRKLDLARDLIGMPEAEAEDALHAIVAEAESFFGKPVSEG